MWITRNRGYYRKTGVKKVAFYIYTRDIKGIKSGIKKTEIGVSENIIGKSLCIWTKACSY